MGERKAWTRFAIAGRLAGWTALSLGLLAPASGQFSPAGAQFQVNSYTTERQHRPAIASDAQGNFVIAWQSWASSGGDTSRTSIQAQRYDAHGAPLGGQFQVNSYTTGYQTFPGIASDAQGNFVVVWQSHSIEGQPRAASIEAQRYDATGSAIGEQFQVNSYASISVSQPAIGSDAQGNFIAVWSSWVSSGDDTSAESIQAQRFAADGSPLAGQFQVNSYTTSAQVFPVIDVEADGKFIVAWASAGSYASEARTLSIQAQRYDAEGAPLGGQFQANSVDTEAWYNPANHFRIAVERQVASGFVVAWASWGSSGGDTSQYSVSARLYDTGGAALGGQFQVNAYTTRMQHLPAIVSDARGNFVIVWTSYGSFEGDNLTSSIQGRRYAAGGAPVAGQFQLNSYTTSFQEFSSIAIDGDGNFVVAWQSNGSSGGDTEDYSIQAQRFDGLFRDDFETGGTARWSATIP